MPAGKRRPPTDPKDTERVARNERIIELYCNGFTQAKIAEAVGLSQSTVSEIILKQKKVWAEQKNQNWDHWQQELIAKQSTIFREAMAGWHRSVGEHTVVNSESEVISEGENIESRKALLTKVKTTKREMAGNATFLRTAQAALDAIARLTGAEAPVRHAHAGPDGESPMVVDVRQMGDDQARLAAELLAKQRGIRAA